MKNIRTIFFDFDGVILESVDIKGWAFGKLFEGYPEHIDAIVAFHYANGGMPRFDKFRHIYKNILHRPLSEIEFNQLCQEFANLVFNRVLECDFVPGALEFLKKYSGRIALFVVSATPQEELTEIVKRRGLHGFFKGVFGSPLSKLELARRILENDGLDSGKVLFVGDALSDYEAAVGNGLKFAARIQPKQDDIFKNKKVDFRIADLFELDRLMTQVQLQG